MMDNNMDKYRYRPVLFFVLTCRKAPCIQHSRKAVITWLDRSASHIIGEKLAI